MGLFERLSEPAKIVIFFYPFHMTQKEGASCTPEHILHGVIHKNPQTFTLVAPEVPDLIERLKQEFCTEGPSSRSDKFVPLPLSSAVIDILRMADRQRARLGHAHVDLQHLLLAILACKGPFTAWFTSRTRHSKAQELLLKHGLTASSVEARIKESKAEAPSQQ